MVLPFHAVIPQAGAGEPLGLGIIATILPCDLCVVLKLLDDISHVAGTNYTYKYKA